MKQIALFGSVLAFGILLAACSPSTSPVPETSSPPAQTETVENNESEVMVGGEQEQSATGTTVDATQESETKVAVQAKNFTFGTNQIKVKKGNKLVIAVTNEQGVHDFVIDELKISSGMIPEGETMEIEIPTDKAGEFEYYCSVGKHREMGMKGTLIVEE